MLDVVTFHSQSISFNALLSILLKFSTSLKGILAKKLLRKKVPNCTKFKTQFKICALFLLIWKIGGLIKFFLGGQRICTHLLKLTKLETCFKHFCTFKTQLVRDFVWSFWNFVNLWNLKHFAPQQNNWSEFGLELLKLCKTYETLKLVVSSILHLEKKLVKDVVWNFWNFVQLVKPQSCFRHVASFFFKPLVWEVLSLTSETLDNLMQLIWSFLHLKKNWSEILLGMYEHNVSWESRNLHTQQLNKARTRLNFPA